MMNFMNNMSVFMLITVFYSECIKKMFNNIFIIWVFGMGVITYLCLLQADKNKKGRGRSYCTHVGLTCNELF